MREICSTRLQWIRVQGFTPPASMCLFWILSCLTVVVAIPSFRDDNSIMRYDLDENSNQEHSVCQTTHCREIAKRIIASRDTTVDPCTDFYEYACGSWSQHNPIPDSDLNWSEDHIITQKTAARIRALLEKEDKPEDIEPVKMVRQFYRSCMDLDAIEKQGIKPLIDLISKTGGWPLAMSLHAWHSQNIQWQDVQKYYVSNTGSSAFFTLSYERNENDTTVNIMSIHQDVSNPLNNKREISSLVFDFNNVYMNAILRVALLFAKEQKYSLNGRLLTQDIIDMVRFETDLMAIIEEAKQTYRLSRDYVTLTIQELQEFYDSAVANAPTAKINFVELIQSMFQRAGFNISSSESIAVYSQNSLRKLATLLGKTRNRVLVNYVQWNAIYELAFYANEEMRKLKFDTYYSQYNISDTTPRWEACISLIEMKDALSYLFVKEYFPDPFFKVVTEMVNGIQEEMESRIMKAKWVNADMRRFMVGKLQKMVKQIGYPSWYKNETAFIKLHEGMKIGPNFFENVINSFEHCMKVNQQRFREAPNREEEWLDFPMTVNAFYSGTVNAIVIPAAELQDPYFTESVPDAVNYGGVGFVIGHEMAHCFDSDGIQHDQEGKKIYWDPDQMIDSYKYRASCFVQQFGNYTVFDAAEDLENSIQIDGELTEDENIADSTGLQAAFAAYRKAKANRQKVTKLPGLENMADDKLFFLSFATSWCEAVRPEFAKAGMHDDDHSPPKFRVIGSLSNMEEFAQTFNCPVNSPMNRKDKCSLWK